VDHGWTKEGLVMARAPVSEAFKQRMWNADFIRQVELPILSKLDLAIAIARNRNKDSTENEERCAQSILKQLSCLREAPKLPYEIARVFAEEHRSSDEGTGEFEENYWRRIWYGSYPRILEDPSLTRRWVELSRTPFNSFLNDHGCAWVLRLDRGEELTEFKLKFDENNKYEKQDLPVVLQRRLETWTTGTKARDKRFDSRVMGIRFGSFE
jgi:hypothetical protein